MYTQHVMNANANNTVLPLWTVNLGFKFLVKLAGNSRPAIGTWCKMFDLKNSLIFVQG